MCVRVACARTRVCMWLSRPQMEYRWRCEKYFTQWKFSRPCPYLRAIASLLRRPRKWNLSAMRTFFRERRRDRIFPRVEVILRGYLMSLTLPVSSPPRRTSLRNGSWPEFQTRKVYPVVLSSNKIARAQARRIRLAVSLCSARQILKGLGRDNFKNFII